MSNVGQITGELVLRIMQLEDEVEALRAGKPWSPPPQNVESHRLKETRTPVELRVVPGRRFDSTRKLYLGKREYAVLEWYKKSLPGALYSVREIYRAFANAASYTSLGLTVANMAKKKMLIRVGLPRAFKYRLPDEKGL